MNERIKELAIESQLVYEDSGRLLTGWLEHVDLSDEVKKFAELIVKEMCDMMEQCEDDCYSLEPSERSTEYIEWLYYWRTRFEKHFGVE